MSEEKTTLIEFPCTFPVKIMGAHHPEFENTILDVIREHAPDTESHQISTRPSSKGNYLGATAQVNVWRAKSSSTRFTTRSRRTPWLKWCSKHENRATGLGRLRARV